MAQEFDVVVIGAGPAGYVAAIRCAQLKLKVAVIEKRMELGGTCLNVGCIPSKTLLHASEMYWKIKKEGKKLGLDGEKVDFQLPRMMERKREVIAGLNDGVKALFKKNQITLFTGTASFLSSNVLSVAQGPTTEQIQAKSIIIATGSAPTPLPFLPFDERRIVSSTGALSLEKVPSSLLVVGAGIIGVELGSVYQRLGSQVTFVEFMDRICPTLDAGLSKGLQESLTKQGMQFHLSSKVTGAQISDKSLSLKVAKEGSSIELQGDVILVSIGRRPYTEGLGLDKAGIELSPQGLIPIDGRFRTKLPHIYAIGDIVDGPMLAHKASEEGVAVAEIIAGQNPHINYVAVPNVVYTHPEVASVGLTEEDAKRLGLTIKSGTCSFKANSRAKCTAEEDGFVKVLADAATDIVVGVHIIGAHASELIAEAVLVINKRLTAEDVGSLCYPHPTLSESIKEAALSIHKKAIHK